MSNLKETKIPYGYCCCGCGQKTKLAKQTNRLRGMKKGEPLKFLHNHHQKGRNGSNWKGGEYTTDQGYIFVWDKNHPNANKQGYVKRSRLVVESILGKYLPKKAVVHHVNGIKDDDRPDNLVVCENNAYHQILHRRQRALEVCGHANWRKCTYCKKYDDIINLCLKKNDQYYFHKECQQKYNRNRYEKQKAKKIKGKQPL